MRSPCKHRAADGTVTFKVRYRFNGRDSSLTFPTNEEAWKFARAADQDMESALWKFAPGRLEKISDADNPTVVEWVNYYIDQLTGLKPNTPVKYRAILNADIKPFFGELRIQQLDNKRVSEWLEWLRTTKKNSAKTQKNKLIVLAAACGLAYEKKLIERIPTRRVKITATLRKKEPVFLTDAETQIVLNSVDEHYHSFILFLVASGCRFSEATALQVRHINAEAGSVEITQAFVGDGGYGYELGTPKTMRSRRTIKVDRAVLAALDCDEDNPFGFVFTNHAGGPIRQSTFANNTWKRATAKMALPDHRKPRLHDLRHTAASNMLAAGERIEMVSWHLGHSTIKTTVDIYGHKARADQASAPVSASWLTPARQRKLKLVEMAEASA